MTLDEKGRCCGRKPLTYRSSRTNLIGPHRFCWSCDRAYHLTENRMIDNWAWHADGRPKRRHQDGRNHRAALVSDVDPEARRGLEDP